MGRECTEDRSPLQETTMHNNTKKYLENIGLAHGKEGAPDKELAGRVMALSSAMQAQFGSLTCSSVLGVDMSTPEGVQLAGKRGLYKTFCPKLVEATVRKLQEIL